MARAVERPASTRSSSAWRSAWTTSPLPPRGNLERATELSVSSRATDAGASPAWQPGTIVDLAVAVDPERDHIRGAEHTPVSLVEYGDFECSYYGQAGRSS